MNAGRSKREIILDINSSSANGEGLEHVKKMQFTSHSLKTPQTIIVRLKIKKSENYKDNSESLSELSLCIINYNFMCINLCVLCFMCINCIFVYIIDI